MYNSESKMKFIFHKILNRVSYYSCMISLEEIFPVSWILSIIVKRI